jgi:hypothetical protein
LHAVQEREAKKKEAAAERERKAEEKRKAAEDKRRCAPQNRGLQGGCMDGQMLGLSLHLRLIGISSGALLLCAKVTEYASFVQPTQL